MYLRRPRNIQAVRKDSSKNSKVSKETEHTNPRRQKQEQTLVLDQIIEKE